jgi:tetratricopeptide (TPR) repeat protein
MDSRCVSFSLSLSSSTIGGISFSPFDGPTIIIIVLFYTFYYSIYIYISRQALACYKQQDDVKAVQYLEASLRRDPWYEPSWLSLIALHLYHQQDVAAAKTRLQQAFSYLSNAKKKTSSTKTNATLSATTTIPATTTSGALTKSSSASSNNDISQKLHQFQLDIMAYEQRLGHMVQTGSFINEYLELDNGGIWQPMDVATTTTPSSTRNMTMTANSHDKALKKE